MRAGPHAVIRLMARKSMSAGGIRSNKLVEDARDICPWGSDAHKEAETYRFKSFVEPANAQNPADRMSAPGCGKSNARRHPLGEGREHAKSMRGAARTCDLRGSRPRPRAILPKLRFTPKATLQMRRNDEEAG